MHLLAIDQGTTGSTALVMSAEGVTLGRATREFPQHFPEAGWVEHEPEEIWQSVLGSIADALLAAQISATDVSAIGITNQRETTLLWDRVTMAPIHRAIVWQDRRTADRCAELARQGYEPKVRERTGLVLDPYFSGTKIEWLLDHVGGARVRAERGELSFGTVDSYLVARLSGGDRHVTDVTNASRTLLMDLRTCGWDDAMCSLLRVPRSVLPQIVPSAGRIASTIAIGPLPAGIPIAGIAGDQQAALFGQACFDQGDAKCTYGTGAFILTNIGPLPIVSRFGLLTTVAWQIGAEVVYALEGSAFVAGAAVQWLRDGLGIIRAAAEVEALARQVPSSLGVTFVPALAGLGAPYWDADARGMISGLTRGATSAHLARAALEGIAFQVDDLVRATADDLGVPVRRLRADGGAARNDLLMQLQADVSDVIIECPEDLESTARGAAMLAGVGCGMFASSAEASKLAPAARTFRPHIAEPERAELRNRWTDAIARTRSRAAPR